MKACSSDNPSKSSTIFSRTKILSMAFAIAMVAGCADDTSSGNGGNGGNGGSAGDGANGNSGGDGGSVIDPESPFAELYQCPENDLSEFRALSGPLFDESGIIGTLQDEYVVHTTQIYTSEEQNADFLNQSVAIFGQLETTEGLVAYAVAQDAGCGVSRTLGVWASEEAMYAFVVSGAHADAMSQVNDLSLTGRVTHWIASAEEVEELDWDVAREKLAVIPASPAYE